MSTKTIPQLNAVGVLLPAALLEISQGNTSFNASVQEALDLIIVANVGAGATIFKDESPTNTFNFKSLLAGTNITLTPGTNDITIAATGTGILTINGDSTSAQIIAAGTGLGIVDAGATHTLAIDATVVTLTGTQTLLNKTLDDITNTIHADTVHEFVRNSSGGILTAGTPVFISGFNVGSNLATVDKADADDASAMPAIGIISADVANNTTGDITVVGTLNNIDTSAWAVGDILYVSTTPGVLTNVRPNATAQVQIVAHVLRVHATMGVLDVEVERILDNPNLADGNFWVGNATAIATAVTMSGDITMDNAGVTSIGTNKVTNDDIIAHTSTKITITAKGQLNGAIVYTDQNNVFGNFLQTFRSQTIRLRNAANTQEYVIDTGAIVAQRIISLPLLTGNDTFVFEAHPATLTNKTITAAANTLTIASTDLTDTADIAYLNTANTYTAGVRQDFLGDTTGTSGLNVGGIAGNPTTQVNGDIWLNTSTNQVFARINGANVDLGAGAAGGDMVLADVQTVTGAKTFGTIGGAVGKLIVAGSTSGTTILNAAAVAGATTMTFPGTSGTVVIIGLANQLTNTELTAGAFAKITGVGTLATGTWEATAIASAFLDADTMHLAVVQTVTGVKQFGTVGGAVGKFTLAGSTSGTTIVNAAAVAGTTTVTLQGVTGTVALLGNKLSDFAATTSAELATVISDETGSGLLVFGTSPVLVTPALGTPSALVLTNATGLVNAGVAAGAAIVMSKITGTAAQFDTALSDDNFVFDGATNVLTGAIQITAGTMRIPLSASPTMAVDGDFAIDTTVTDFSHGVMKFYDGEEIGVVAMPIAQFTTPGDGEVVTYNATNDEFELAAAGGGATVSTQTDVATSAENTTSTSYVSTNMSITLANRSGGIADVKCSFSGTLTTDNGNAIFDLFDDGVAIGHDGFANMAISDDVFSICVLYAGSLDGSVINLRMKTSGGTLTLAWEAATKIPTMTVSEVS